ncbi:major facilitator superfamily domain-containing protein [Xylaria bambusicola]|uniref:major facilitator superfamily domain-containing protein n=1 Tax=Xylaria bambusicola TaxID=326684 RepID=UPI0020089C8F|nr:major facilitator superfamily domain-containing protein [Xylaria bambusicola]KAI0502857.1 major facilitator superfamily domain-containing protein [Xylaria bambusicola]
MDAKPPPINTRTEPDALGSREEERSTVGHPPQFWLIIVALSLLVFISAVDVTIIPPALPRIVEEIGGSTQYVWIANSFVFVSSVLQPLIGQLSNIFGRKYPIVVPIILFIVGSGSVGGAQNAGTLITGRTV